MARLSDEIERFIKNMLLEADNRCDLKRNELAAHFGCAPSQINYVLDTRFTVNHGYVVESRRGGGGYIRIMRVVMNDGSRLLNDLYERIGGGITREEAAAILRQLHERGIISREAAYLLYAAVDTRGLDIYEDELKRIRAHALRNIIAMILGNGRGEEKNDDNV